MRDNNKELIGVDTAYASSFTVWLHAGGLRRRNEEYVQTIHNYVFLIELMRWINISIFFPKMFDESIELTPCASNS